ncbi:MAG: DUF87 domain-containing protein [Candidatus Aenigmatarchaeota archaeon]
MQPYYQQIFNVTQQILIRFNTTSDCSAEGLIANATSPLAQVELRSPTGEWEVCSPLNNELDGWYNCTWDSTGKKEGYWTINLTASKLPNYNLNETMFVDWLWLENLNATSENASVYVWNYSTSSWQKIDLDEAKGWSSKFNFTLDIYDQEGDTINCSLFISKDDQESWEYVGSSLVQGTHGIPTSGICNIVYQGFSCENMGNKNWFKWQIQNGEPANTYNTSAFNAPKLTESIVSISLIEGNNSYINRSSGINQVRRLAVNVFDVERFDYVSDANVSFWVTNDSINYRVEALNQTNSQGNVSYYFNPNCTHEVGKQYWKAGTTDSCYVDVNTSEFTLTIIGELIGTIHQPNGQEFLRGSNVTINASLYDECSVPISEADVNFTMKSLQTSQELVCSPVINNSNIYNCTFNTSSPTIMPARWYNVSMKSNKTYYNTNITTKYQAFWIETTPELINPVAIPSGDGGWGESWIFRVNFTDEDLDNNWVKLWLNRHRPTDPTQVAVNQTVSGINITVEFNLATPFSEDDFNTNKTVDFKFNATDAPPAGNPEDQADTGWQSLELKPDNVSISLIEPINLIFNRSSQKNSKINYTAQIIDTDKNQPLPGGRTAKFYYTKDGSNFIDSGFKFTVSGGYVTQNITLDCSYSVGPQYWLAGTANQTTTYAWEIKNSSTVSFTIITENLTVNITAPINNYPWNAPRRSIDNITLYADVKDDCGYVPGATLVFYVYDPNCGGGVCDCTSVTDYGNGTYSCTILASQTSTWDTGWHNVSVEVSKQYYNGSSDFQQDAFYLATMPDITPTGYPPITAVSTNGDGGWGEIWKFEAWVVDWDDDDVNVSLYLNLSGNWVLRNSTVIKAQTPTQVTFYNTFDCDDIGNDKGYKFVVTDVWNYQDQENSTFNIYKDDTTIEYITGSGEQVSREGSNSVLMKVKILDSDRNNVLVGENRNGSLYVTTQSLGGSGNLSTYILYYKNKTDSESILTFNFDPNCSLGVGVQNWKAGIEGDVCYKDNQPEYGFNVNITGQLKVNLIAPTQGSNIIVGEIVNINSSVFSDCSNEGLLSGAEVKHEARSPSLQFENIQPVEDQGNGYYNTTWNTSFHAGGNWSFRINASLPNYYSNSTLFLNWVYLNNTPPIVENMSVAPSSGGWGENFTFSMDVSDAQQDNVTCKLFVYTGKQEWEYKGDSKVNFGVGKCIVNVSDFTCQDINTSSPTKFKFQIEDGTASNTFNTSEVLAPEITRNDVLIEYVYGNESSVNRNGDNSALLILRIFDTIKGSYVGGGVESRIFVTKDGNNYDIGTSNTTNSSSYLNIYFNPETSYSIGKQKWKGGSYGDACYKDANTTEEFNLTIITDLFNNLLEPSQGSEFLRGENITFIFTITDEQPIGIEGSNTSLTLINENSQSFECSPIVEYGGGEYRCTINTSYPQLLPARWYNVSIHSNKTYYIPNTTLYQNTFFIKTKPELTASNVSSQQGSDLGGWGETWTFKVNVTDEDRDNVTVYLKIKKFTEPETAWQIANVSSYEENPDLQGPINKTVVITYKNPGLFQNAQEVWQFKFEAEDSRFYTSNTSAKNFTIEKDDVEIQLVAGNNEIVWRNGTQTISLKVNLTDTDQNIPAVSANVTFWITTDGLMWDSGTVTLTDVNGIAEYPFDPNCDYSTGIQNWKAGSMPNFYYKYVNTSNFTLTIKTFIALNISYPDEHAFLVGTKVPFIGQAYDECSGIPGASVTFSDNFGASWYDCAPVSDQGNGTYNCTFDTTGRPFGWHNIRMRANKQYYGNYPTPNETIKTNAYFVASQPVLSNPSLDHTIGGWGELYTFSVQLTDTDKNYNNVSLWKSFDQSNWTLVDSKMVQPTYSNYPVTFQKRFTCEDYLNATNGKNYWKINTTDIYGYSDETSVFNFTLDVDNVTVQIGSGSSSNVRRIGDNLAYLRFIIYDSDRGVYTNDTNGTFWITRDGANYDYSLTCLSYLGNCTVNYNPDCSSSVGIQYWKAGTTDICYQKLNTTNASLTVYGQLNVSLINPSYGAILNRDVNASLNASVSNDCGQQVTDATVNWYNSSWVLLASGYNTSWKVPATYKLGTETIYSNASRQYYDPNSNNTQVWIYGWSGISSILPQNGSVFSAGLPVNLQCDVVDMNTLLPIENYTVFFFKNGNSLANVSTNSEGRASTTWYTTGESAGWYNITCEIKHNSTLYYNASLAQREAWIKLSRPLIIDSIIRQYTSIYRNDSFEPYKTNIAVHVKDANIGDAENSNVTFYNSSSLLGNCTTNSTGWCSLLNFNPEDAITPQLYLIYINATRPQNEDSATNVTTIFVKGILNTTIIAPENNSIYSKSQSIPLKANGTSENGESFLVLNPTIKWYNETAEIAQGNDTYLPQIKVAEQRTGMHQFMAVASKDYYDDGKANITITITGLADVEWISPTGIIPYPSEFYPTCLVKDHESGSGIPNYVVNFSYMWEPSSEFIFNGSHITNSSGYASYSFVPEQKGNITFNCTIGDNTTQYYSANIKEALETIWVKDIEAPYIFNISILPNESIEANLNSTNISVTVIDNYEISSVWANITLPNGTILISQMSNITVPEISFGLYKATYSVSYLPPIGGVYNVTIYAKDSLPESNVNSTFAGNFSVWGKTAGLMEQLPLTITAYNITQTQGFVFEVSVNYTNLGPATAYSANLTHAEDPIGSVAYNESMKQCGTMYAGQNCSWAFKVTVPEKTSPQLIIVSTIATWGNPDKTSGQSSNQTQITVSSNPVIEVSPKSINKSTPHDATTYIGNMTTSATGNDGVEDVVISTVGGNLAIDCPLCELMINPSSYGLLAAGENFTSHLTITVPAGQAPGIYWTKIRASSKNAGYDELLLNLTIPQNTSWIRSPETFGTVLLPLNTSGTIGNISVSNIGNVKIPFEILKSGNGTIFIQAYPSGAKGTTAFDLEKQVSRNVTVEYSVPWNAIEAIYTVNIIIRNVTFADPPQRITSIILNVTDIPPTITDVLIEPRVFEIGYENVTVQAKITDNFAVDKAWINVTLPNGSTYEQFMDSFPSSIYNTTYVSSDEGIHLISICANDTRSLVGCTSPIEVEGSATTWLEAIPNATLLTANDVTIEYGQNFTVNITLNNTGGSRAFDSNLTIESESIISDPSFFDFGTILKFNSKSSVTSISVPSGTQPGIYEVNLTARWKNLNQTYNTSSSQILVNVTENPKIKVLEENISKIVPPGVKDSFNITLKSIGNWNATNVEINCSEGVACEDFNISFEPRNFTLIPIGEARQVNVSLEVPPNYLAGTHNGTAEIRWNSLFSLKVPIYITVPINISWGHEPKELNVSVLQDFKGYFGSISIINTGNAEITLKLIKTGEIAPYINLSESEIVLPYGQTKIIHINYSSPDIQFDREYKGKIISNITGELRENATVKTRETNVSMFVSVYKVKIKSPTKFDPITGITNGSTIIAKVNVTANSSYVTENVSFNVSLFDFKRKAEALVNFAYYNSSENLWWVNFTAPDLETARVYSLNITASYNNTKYLVRSDVENDSIVYLDTEEPWIDIIINTTNPSRIPANSTVGILMNVTESGGIKNISGNVTYPDGREEAMSLILVSRIGDNYLYGYDLTNTSTLGNYTIKASVCDLSGNCNSTSKSFEIYPTAIFSGYAKDVEAVSEPPLRVKFEFYDQKTGKLEIYSNATDGYYNETIDAKQYTYLKINLLEQNFNHQIVLNNLNITSNYFNPIVFGNVPNARTTSSAIKSIYIDTVLAPEQFTLIMNFTDCSLGMCNVPIYSPSKLGIYRYTGTWVPKISSTNNMNWERITNIDGDNTDNSVNLTTLTASVNLTNIKGLYVLAEFICGDGRCESGTGESSTNCPLDCPFLPGGGGGGGPGGGGAGGGAGGIVIPPPAAPTITPTVPQPVPLEIKSTLLETTLIPGEEKIFSVDITNNLDESVRTTVTVEGPAFSLLTVQRPVLTVAAKSTEVVNIKAYAQPATAAGIYTGDIVVTAGNVTHRTPVTIKVQAVLEPLLDVKLKALSKVVAPGDNLIFEVSLINMGQTASVEDITVTYTVKLMSDETKVIATSKETLAVDNVLTYRREIQIPEGTPQDKYIIEVNASYWYGKKFAASADSFEVSELPVPLLILRAALLSPITYIVLFLGVPSVIIGSRWYAAYRAARLAKARYVAPVDFKSLPKAGPNSIEVGKIAETDVKAYIDIPQLIMHSIAAGGSGSGKSVSAMICAEELLKRKVPIIVFDPTAQWTGFMKPCKLKAMLDLYPKFGLKPTDARSFKTNVVLVEDPEMPIDLKKYMNPGEITVFVMNRLKPEQLDGFVRRSVQAVFDMRPPESKEIKLLLVWDEVHRLLPKYGGKGGYVAIERACREFRKWGIGVFVISQVLLDFKGAIRANIANEIQLRTKYEGDIGRVKSKYGIDYASKVTRLTIGTALFQNPEYNNGRPWFISFRPLLHSPFALTDDEINQYVKLNKKIEEIEGRIQKLKAKGIDTYDLEIELNIAKDKVKTAAFKMAETYLESVEKRIEKLEGKK